MIKLSSTELDKLTVILIIIIKFVDYNYTDT